MSAMKHAERVALRLQVAHSHGDRHACVMALLEALRLRSSTAPAALVMRMTTLCAYAVAVARAAGPVSLENAYQLCYEWAMRQAPANMPALSRAMAALSTVATNLSADAQLHERAPALVYHIARVYGARRTGPMLFVAGAVWERANDVEGAEDDYQEALAWHVQHDEPHTAPVVAALSRLHGDGNDSEVLMAELLRQPHSVALRWLAVRLQRRANEGVAEAHLALLRVDPTASASLDWIYRERRAHREPALVAYRRCLLFFPRRVPLWQRLHVLLREWRGRVVRDRQWEHFVEELLDDADADEDCCDAQTQCRELLRAAWALH